MSSWSILFSYLETHSVKFNFFPLDVNNISIHWLVCLCVHSSFLTYCTHPQSAQTIREITRMAHSGSANKSIREVECLRYSWGSAKLIDRTAPSLLSALVSAPIQLSPLTFQPRSGCLQRKWTAGFTKLCGSEAALLSRVCVWRRTWQLAGPKRMHANTVLGVSEMDLWLTMATVSHTNH